MLKKLGETLQTGADFIDDTLEKASTPASRAGHVIERAGKLLAADVSPEVVALQLSLGSANKNKYTVAHVEGFGQLYQDMQTRVNLTAAQTTGLLKDQRDQNANAPEIHPGQAPQPG